LEGNFRFHPATAHKFMRIAHYEHHLRNPTSINIAIEQLRGLPQFSNEGGPPVYPEWMHEEARSLHAQGLNLMSIADRLDVHSHTITYWLDPEKARGLVQARRQRRRAEKQAFKDQEQWERREEAASAADSELAAAYSTIRLHLDVLDKAILADADVAIRGLLREARSAATQAEAKIIRALGTS